jgi:F0F1-type ATP synthase membrane subunit b/b'
MEALLGILTNLGFDSTLWPLLALMVGFHVLLSATYLRPHQALLRHRKEQTEGIKKEAQALSARADDRYSLYRSHLKKTNDAITKIFHRAEEDAKKEEAQILEAASKNCRDMITHAQQTMNAEKVDLATQLRGQVPGLADEIVSKALGRSLNMRS